MQFWGLRLRIDTGCSLKEIDSHKKKQHRPPSKKKKREKNLSPRNMKACQNINNALLQSIGEIGTRSTMKSNKATFHELSPKIPQKPPKRNKSSSTKDMLHTDITIRAQRTKVSSTHAKKATIYHQKSHAINQLNRRRRQPAFILHSEVMVAMDRLKRRRAKQSRSAEVRIKFAMLSS
jgi:hypothetical protein